MIKDIIPEYSDILPNMDNGDFATYIAYIKLDKNTASKRINDYNLGKSEEEIYRALIFVKFENKSIQMEGYTVLKPVKKNVVGSINANDAYILVRSKRCDFDNNSISIEKISLLERVNKIPDAYKNQ
jgi:hypothetical protein